jgi:hypothetical protein
MSKKDYELIVKAIRQARDRSFGGSERIGIIQVVNQLVPLLKADNPNFDADKFRKACES